MNVFGILELTIASIFFILFMVFMLSAKKNRTYAYNTALLAIKKIIYWLAKIIMPIVNLINPIPFQSVLIQLTLCYIVFFAVFITHPFPILKRWPKTTNGILIGTLIFLLLANFIQFNVPFFGSMDNVQINQWPKGFHENIHHFKKNIGFYLAVLVIMTIMLLAGIFLSYTLVKHTNLSLILFTLIILTILGAIFTLLYPLFRKVFNLDIPSLKEVFTILFIFIPSYIFYYIVHIFKVTPTRWLVLFGLEIAIILAYFIFPLIVNMIYMRSPGDPGYTSVLKDKIKGTRHTIQTSKKELTYLQHNININWSTVASMNDDDLRVKLFDLGYTESTVASTIKFIRQNQQKVADKINKYKESKRTLKRLQKEYDSAIDHTSTMLLRDPVYTDTVTSIGTFENLTKGREFNYQYTLSAWIFLNNQGPNHSLAYNKDTSLLNYGGKPNILYNAKEETLTIQMLSGNQLKTIYQTKEFPMQKWNNIVINYDKGTLDIFLNGRLVSTTPGIVPYMQHENIIAGEKDGLSGGICNVTYFSGNLSRERIELFYNLLKSKSPPLFPAPFRDLYKNTIEVGENTYHKHPIILGSTLVITLLSLVMYVYKNRRR